MFITLIDPAEIWVSRISTLPKKTSFSVRRILGCLECPFIQPFVVFRMTIRKSK